MGILSLFISVVFAAETILSPIPDGTPIVIPQPPKPTMSFGQITQVLGAAVEATPTPIPTPTPIVAKKKSYTIAFLGDSMIDTMGPGLPAVQNALTNVYAATKFNLLNYGVGGTNIDYGITRITGDYDYLGKHVLSLASAHPDIVVLESFGYNPFPVATGIDRHWLALSTAVDTLRQNIPGAKIIIAATIAPNSKVFGDGAPGIAFSPQDKVERTNVIKSYLDSTVKFARSQNLPLADAYHASMDGSGDGILSYINPGDHIHYSDAGRALFANTVFNAIAANHLLE